MKNDVNGGKRIVKKIRKCFREGTDCIRKSVEAKHKWGKGEEDIPSKNGNIVQFFIIICFHNQVCHSKFKQTMKTMKKHLF